MPSFRSVALLGLAAFGAVNAQLTDAEAQQIATNYGDLIAAYSDSLADASLAPNFTDYSESVNSLINGCPQGDAAISLPLLAPTFSSLAQFKRGQGQQAPINFKQLNIWHDADTVIIRWTTTNTAPIPDPKPVVGLITMHVVPAPSGNKYPYLIDNVYSEFDAAAWLQNLVDAGFCSTNGGLAAGNATSTASASSATSAAPAASTCTASTVTLIAPATACTPASMATGTGSAAAPYQTGSYNGTWGSPTGSAATGSASNPPAYTGPAFTGAASSMKSSYAGLSAIFLGLLVFLN